MIEELNLTLIFGITILIISIFYKYVKNRHKYFEKIGVPYFKPYFLLGNLPGLLLRKISFVNYITYFYGNMYNHKIMGLFDILSPIFLIRDPELIKKFGIKDFDYFENHRSFIDDKTDKLFGNSLFFLQSQKWRDMRSTLSPVFTGNRMRHMFELVAECAAKSTDYFVEKSRTSSSEETMNFNMKELFARYANDVIATCAYGIKVNSFDERDNEFFTTGLQIGNVRRLKGVLKSTLIRILPKIAIFFDIQLADKIVRDFFRSMVLTNIENRDRKGIYRPDMINVLKQVRKGNNQYDKIDPIEKSVVIDSYATVEESNIGKSIVKRKWNDDEIVAQCFIFFVAGFDTTSTLLTFAAYEIAVNSDVQQKLFNEIQNVQLKCENGQLIDYDSLQNMCYMDMVISEVLRLWPPVPVSERECVKDYQFEYDGMKTFKIHKGDVIWLPIFPVHRDDKYFPNANKFDPERFNAVNKDNIVPGTYSPFGIGPRNCIGSRFALMKIKAILYYLLLNFSFEPNADTPIPMKLGKNPLVIGTEKPVMVTLRRRS